TVVSGDKPYQDDEGEGSTVFDSVEDSETPELLVLRQESTEAVRTLVQHALAALDLDDLDRAIIATRLMVPKEDRVSLAALGKQHQVTGQAVLIRERNLLRRLRLALGLPADGVDGVF